MKDFVKIHIESGKGGDGIIAFDNNRKADGGNGGKGGDVYLEGTTNVFDFKGIDEGKSIKAEDGHRGEKYKKSGKDGDDLVIYVPLVTKVFNEDKTEVITITKPNQRVKVLTGGNGGLGNFSLRGSGWDGKLTRKKGEDSELKTILLELNLRADAIFLGYPNAGKSSIINSLTNAEYKVAPYEFTTLQPQLGVMDGKILMDLPGLIEGTYKGKGVGTQFLKHTRYAKLLVHCISLENDNLLERYKSMRDEFGRISEDLYSLEELVVFTKADVIANTDMKEKEGEIRKDFKNFVIISVYRKEDLGKLKSTLKERLSSISRSAI